MDRYTHSRAHEKPHTANTATGHPHTHHITQQVSELNNQSMNSPSNPTTRRSTYGLHLRGLLNTVSDHDDGKEDGTSRVWVDRWMDRLRLPHPTIFSYSEAHGRSLMGGLG